MIGFMTEKRLLKLMIIGVILLLLGALLGYTRSYTLLRWDVMGLCAIVALQSFSSRRYYWGWLFVFFGILFNPFHPPAFSRTEWQVLDAMLIALLFGWLWDYFTNYRKGLLFERYILNKFPKEDWDVVSSTMDLHKKLKRIVESDANPDFVFRNRASGKTIAVECKYRSEYITGTKGDRGIWWKQEQGERYAQFAQKNNIPVYIVIGVGGNPKFPKTIGYIPLELIQKQYYHFVPQAVMEIFCSLPQK